MQADNCPTCGGEAVMQCRCLLGDKVCAAGHHWYHCPEHGTVILGEADHGGDTMSCRYPNRPVYVEVPAKDHRCPKCQSLLMHSRLGGYHCSRGCT